MGRKKINWFSFSHNWFFLFLIKAGFFVILLKLIPRLTGFAVFQHIQETNPVYPLSGGLILIAIGIF